MYKMKDNSRLMNVWNKKCTVSLLLFVILSKPKARFNLVFWLASEKAFKNAGSVWEALQWRIVWIKPETEGKIIRKHAGMHPFHCTVPRRQAIICLLSKGGLP
jgi:hypothetical protein